MKIRNEKGFTVIELIIVLVIIGILAITTVPKLLESGEQSRTATCLQNQVEIEKATSLWFSVTKAVLSKIPTAVDSAQYPKSIQDMVDISLLENIPICPAGGIYVYNSETGKVRCIVEKHARTTEE